MKWTNTIERDGEEVTVSSFNIREGQDTVEAAKESAISILASYAKSYKLLHQQLWDKMKLLENTPDDELVTIGGTQVTAATARSYGYTNRVVMANYEITLNDRPVKPIKYWNIKSPSRLPYIADDLNALGLNQLFTGNSPYEEYPGELGGNDPYHDDSLIQPKATDLPSYDRMGWYIEGNGHWLERDTWGEVLTTNVYTYEKFETVEHPEIPDDPETPENEYQPAWTEQVSQGMYAVVVTPNGSSEFALAMVSDNHPERPQDYYPSAEYTNFSQYNPGKPDCPLYPRWAELPDMSEHGAVVYETTEIGYTQPRGTFSLARLLNPPDAITRVYSDGTAVQFTTSVIFEYDRDGLIVYDSVPATIKYLPLVYTDNGQLVQNRVDFIENWDDQFELYVKEDSEWYMDFLGIFVVVISTIIAIFTSGAGGIFSGALTSLTNVQVVAIMSSVIGAIGSVSGSKVLQAIGILGAIYNLGANSFAQEAGKQAMQKGLGERAANQIAKEALVDATVVEAFKGLSTVGLKETLQLALALNNLVTIMTTADVSVDVDSELQAEQGMEEGPQGSGNEYVSKVLQIGDLPRMTV